MSKNDLLHFNNMILELENKSLKEKLAEQGRVISNLQRNNSRNENQ